MAAALDYAYHYSFVSRFERVGPGRGLSLATFGGEERNPHFFAGWQHGSRMTST